MYKTRSINPSTGSGRTEGNILNISIKMKLFLPVRPELVEGLIERSYVFYYNKKYTYTGQQKKPV